MKTLPLSFAIATAMLTSISAISAEQALEAVELDVVTVSADFRDSNVQELAEAVTVIGTDKIDARNAQHLESVLSLAPNGNYSSGASRGRYFQIRGIGERSQFVDPVNPSVGLMIDGIDMTGLGGAATLLDVKQVEILRGPQGTRFGANALAGMINIKSKDATKDTEGYVAAKVGNYNTHSESAAISGSITDNMQGRLAINSFQSEGYMKNEFLGKENTNNIDEVVARGKLAAQLSANTNLGLSYFYADIDNGYDAFSLDNNRTTYSDEPGIDAQETHAFALSLDSKLNSSVILETEITTAKSDVEYSYDVDWAFGKYDENTGNCDTSQGACLEMKPEAWGYSYADQYLRDYQRNSADIRLLSAEDGRIFAGTTDWVVGAYHQMRSESLTRSYTPDPQYSSELKIASTSLYIELSTDITEQARVIYGVRAEQWQNDFSNSLNTGSDETELLFGGQLTLENLVNNDHLAYITLARGYKAGGANSASVVTEKERIFDTEYNNSLELGLKSSLFNDELVTRIAAFHIQRKNQQVKQSFVSYDDGVPDFTDYIANAAEGKNQGLEIESQWQLLEQLRWDLSFGYLKAEFTDYEISAKDDDDASKMIDKKGRAQALAPEYGLATGLSFSATEALTFSLESEAKDEFYFSDSHDEKSKAYVLWHARVAFQQGPFQAALFGRNLTGKEQEVRGFNFGNDPRDGYSNTRWVQLGEPRLVGIEGRYSF
ncbi:MAG: TonB-dependent receptor [Oleispira sp.]|nr:TonB-dependent receptor [Oleispira sp.]